MGVNALFFGGRRWQCFEEEECKHSLIYMWMKSAGNLRRAS